MASSEAMVSTVVEQLLSMAGLANDPQVVHLLRSIMFRASAASITAFVVTLLFGPSLIRWLARRWREPIVSPSEKLMELHRNKAGTPTMGGLLILGATGGSVVLWADLSSFFLLVGLLLVGGLGVLGFLDDWLKVRGIYPRGLPEWQKLLGQLLLAGAALISVYVYGQRQGWAPILRLPGWPEVLFLGWWVLPWGLFVLIATTNAVNLSDGLDGLACGCYLFSGAAVGVLTYVASHAGLARYFEVPHVREAGEVTILVASSVGAALGFLWFNCPPAQVFMGDTGSLALGGLLAYAAFVARQEIPMAVAAGIYTVEATSVLLQRFAFKLTRRRIFRCAPLHHHFQFLGVPESRIVIRSWIAAAVLAILSVAALKLP